MSLVQNERTKLTATALNGVAIAAIAAGFITPLAAATFAVPGSPARGWLVTTVASGASSPSAILELPVARASKAEGRGTGTMLA